MGAGGWSRWPSEAWDPIAGDGQKSRLYIRSGEKPLRALSYGAGKSWVAHPPVLSEKLILPLA